MLTTLSSDFPKAFPSKPVILTAFLLLGTIVGMAKEEEEEDKEDDEKEEEEDWFCDTDTIFDNSFPTQTSLQMPLLLPLLLLLLLPL